MKMIIGGKLVDSCSGNKMKIVNPGNGEFLDTVPEANTEDINLAIKSALKGVEEVKKLPRHKRSEILFNTSQKILEHKEELAVLLSKENGKTISAAKGEISGVARVFIGFSETIKRHNGISIPMDANLGSENMIAYTVREPVGIVLGIIPFNSPPGILSHKLAPAFAAGNAFIGKLPEEDPLTTLRISEFMLECGAPENSINILTGKGKEVGGELAKRKEINMITFTGSTETGISLLKAGADTIKRIQLELGGSSPVIICDDADLDLATDSLIDDRIKFLSGQLCVASKRSFIQKNVFEQFKNMLIQKIGKLKIGDQLDPNTDVGPLISNKAALKVKTQVDESIQMGAKCLIGNEIINKTFFKPTVLTEVNFNMPVLKEEVFGPVIPLYPFQTDEEAIEFANNTEYGLSGAVFTVNINRALKISNSIKAGTIAINRCGNSVGAKVPYGGYKKSGIGREGYVDSLDNMTEKKVIVFCGIS